jgi:two-component system response regulator AtoC
MATAPLAGLNVLVVDDEPMLRRHLVATLERMGAETSNADSLRAARQLAHELSFDFVLLDVNLPDGLGLDLLRERAFGTHTGVVVMTAEGGIRGAVEAIQLGALDYLTKPFDPEGLALVLTRGRRTRAQARAEEHRKADSPAQSFVFGETLAALEQQLSRILTADRRMGTELPPVLIQGETGTGKTTIARWLHERGPRPDGPMVEMNCSAIPESLAESEMFGHEKGSFTDARSARLGLFEAAAGGTLFLDEINSLSPSLQGKLLTAIEERRIRRVGGNRLVPVDVRIVAAANRDLRQEVAAGRFREDLFHRLDLFRIAIPPLRVRGADILRLAESLIQRSCRRHRLAVKGISELGRRRLLNYGWPGNVRELSHEIERALVFEDGPELRFDQLLGATGGLPEAAAHPTGLATGVGPVAATEGRPSLPGDWFVAGYRFPESGFSLEDAILRLIHHALDQKQGNVSGAARLLGVSRDYLRYRLGASRPDPETTPPVPSRRDASD